MKKTIPFFSFEKMHADVMNELMATSMRVIESNWYILGKEVLRFESNWASFIGSKHAIAVNSGLDALVLSLRVLGIGKGDEVIVASNAYIACWNAIHMVGASIIPVEPDPLTSNLDPFKIEEKITSRTKAIMPVHLYGMACEMDMIMDIARRHKLFVIEDNAQAQGCKYKGLKTGVIGHVNATSFYPTKNLGALGDAGIVSCNSDHFAEEVKILRNYGANSKYFNRYIGLNSRMDEMQAAFLNVKLKRLDQWNDEKVKLAHIYHEFLEKVEQIQRPPLRNNQSHTYHIYCIHAPQRNDLKNFLADKGIQTSIHYPLPSHLQKAYQFLEFKKGDFPIAEQLAKSCLSLPIYPGLKIDEIRYICDSIASFYN